MHRIVLGVMLIGNGVGSTVCWASGPADLGNSQEILHETLQKDDALFASLREKGSGALAGIEANVERLQIAKRQTLGVESKQVQFDVLWRLARSHYYYATFLLLPDQPGQKEKREKAYQEGLESAQRCMDHVPNRVEGFFWYAVNAGRYGELNGAFKSFVLLKSLKAAALRASELDPSYDSAGALRVLGRIYHKVPGFFGGSNKKALHYFDQAIRSEAGGKSAMNYFFRGDVHWDQKNFEEASQDYKRALEIIDTRIQPGELEAFQNRSPIQEAWQRTQNVLTQNQRL